RELLERHRGARRVVLDVLADFLEERPGLVPAGDRIPSVLVAEDVGQTADDRARGAGVRGTRVHELARVGLHPRLELVRRPRRRLDLGGVVDEDGPPVAHDRRQQEALALALQHLPRVGQLFAGEERVVLREELDELAVVGEHGAGVLPDEEQVHVDTSRVLLRLDLRGQLRRRRALEVHRLDLLRMGLRVALSDDTRRREIAGDVDDGDRGRPLCGGVPGRIDGDPRQRKRERDGGDEGASHRASSGKAPRWYSTAAAGASPQRAWRHFTSTNTQAPPSRQTRSSSPSGNLTLRSTTTRPARARKAAAASSAWRPRDWRGSAIPANTTGASARECREKLTQRRFRLS